ncbi:MAG: N-6 DNA methylase [Firmicutes bacterium]|nr:N-6 DNA methylase [Bacillota bacterium]
MYKGNFKKTGLLVNHLYDLGFTGIIWASFFRGLSPGIKFSNNNSIYIFPKDSDVVLLGGSGVPVAMINVLEMDDLAQIYRLETKIDKEKNESGNAGNSKQQENDSLLSLEFFNKNDVLQKTYALEPLHFKTISLELSKDGTSVNTSSPLNEILPSLGTKKRKLDGKEPALIDKSCNTEYLNLICRHIRVHSCKNRGAAGKILAALFRFPQEKDQEKILYSLADEPQDRITYRYCAKFINETGFDVLDLSIEQLDNLLGFSSVEKENLRGFGFALDMLRADRVEHKEKVYIPFFTSDALTLEVVRKLQPSELRCYSKADYVIADILADKYEKYIFAKKEIEEILTAKYTADLIISYPPFKEYITKEDILKKFFFYGLMGDRKKVEVEVLALEHCLDNLAPGGRLLAFVTNSFLTSLRFQSIREKLMRETAIKAIISFPPSMLHPHWGYEVALIYLEKLSPGKTIPDHVFMGKIDTFEPAQIKNVLDDYTKGAECSGQ